MTKKRAAVFGGVALLLVVVAWCLLRLPELERRPDRLRTDQLARLKKICASLYLYAGDFECFPASLAELYPNYIELKVFGGRVEGVDEIDSLGEFVYVPGRKLDDLGDEIIVYSKPTLSKDRQRSVLFVGGYIDTVDDGVLQAMVRRER